MWPLRLMKGVGWIIFQNVKSNGFCEEPYGGTQHCTKTAQVPNSGFPFTEGLQSLYLVNLVSNAK